MTVINTNSAALMARAYGEKANQNMLKPIERLSSGLRINSASDDAAGLAVSNKMTANIKDYDMAVRNSVDMISLLATAEAALAQINQIQSRLMELAIQSANGVYTQQDRDSMEMELYGLVAEIDRIALNTKFSETNLLDGSFEVSGSSARDILPVSLSEFSTSTVGRYWATDSFENSNFATQGPVTNISATENRFPGWAVFNERVRLGKGATPGTTSIGGYNAPIDPTPNPHQNITGVNGSGNPATGLDDEAAITGTGSRATELGTASTTGFAFDATGGIKLFSSNVWTENDPYSVVHGPYLISQEAKEITAGDVVKFDWKSAGTDDAASIYAYLLDVDTGDTIELIDYTQSSANQTTPWATKSTNITRSGNYQFVFISGSYDATGGTKLGAAMYVNNIIIDRNRLPASMQHLVSQISVQSEAEAKNATEVLSYSIEQTGFTRAILGATINRYQSSIEGALVRGADMRKARSRVMDAEYTIETSKLAKQQILAQASMAMLAQANASKDAVLELIR